MSNTKTSKKNNNHKKGFANPELRKNINKGGRPKGSRNKSKAIAAQLKLDDNAEVAAEVLLALCTNNKEVLGIKDDVPLTLREKAASKILDKAVANEKEKEAATRDEKDVVAEVVEEEVVLFSPIANED